MLHWTRLPQRPHGIVACIDTLRRAAFCSLLVLMIALSGCSAPPRVTDEPAPVRQASTYTGGAALVTGRAPVGAIITMEPAGGAEAPLPEGPVIMDQYARQFVPSLLFSRVGQAVEFRNSEDVDHNVLVVRSPTGTTVRNESGSQGFRFTHTFEQAGSYDVSCDVHPGMRAMIVVTHAPYASGTDASGAYSFYNVPAGEYAMTVLVNGKETRQRVKVTGPTTEIASPTR